MSETLQSATPRKLFNRETKGMVLAPVTVQIERGRIAFFTQVLGERDPLFTDPTAARAMGHPDIAAPPSFYMVVEALANDELNRTGRKSAAELAGCDFRYLLHGEEHYTYEGLIYAGDTVSLTTTIFDFYEKKVGLLEFVTFESVIAHAKRGVLVRTKRTFLHRFG